MADFNAYPSLDIRPTDFTAIPRSQAALNALQQTTQQRGARFPLEQEQYQQENALRGLDVQQATNQSLHEQLLDVTGDPDVNDTDQDAASKAWDAKLQAKADAQTDPAKKKFFTQYIGKYTQQRKEDTTRYAAPYAALARSTRGSAMPGAAGPGLGGAGPSSALAGQPFSTQQMAVLSQRSAQDLQPVADNINQNLQDIQSVKRAGAQAPAAWAAIQMKHPEAAQYGPYSPALMDQLEQQATARKGVIDNLISSQSGGAGPAGVPEETKMTPTGRVIALGADASGKTSARELLPAERAPANPDYTHIGDTKDGKPIFLDKTTGKTTIGDATVGTDQYNKGDDESGVPASDFGNTDPESNSITKVTGLSLPAFAMLTGKSSARWDKNTRIQANKDAKEYVDKNGVDISTLQSQYDGLNNTLKQNVSRVANTKTMEGEMLGTLDNLKPVFEALKTGNLKPETLAEYYLKGQVNNPLVQQYDFQLGQLRNELAGYFAALKNKTGSQIDDADRKDAESVITNGLSAKGAGGLKTSIEASVHKMQGVFEQSEDRSRQGVWNLFGVGDKFKPRYSPPASAGYQQAPNGNYYKPDPDNKGKFLMWRPAGSK